MRIVMTCGGTGGHITPALAIADTVKENISGAEIRFTGSEGGMENELVRAAGYEITPFRVRGLSHGVSPADIGALFLTARAVKEARALLSEYRPDIVVGTGGYACYPTLRAACALGIPTAVHESNAVPGLAVRMLAPRVDRIWLNFGAAGERIRQKEKLLTVGNPLPRGFGAPESRVSLPAGCRRMVLSFGGSLGASVLNRAILDVMEAERPLADVCHIHAAGKREYETMRAAFIARGFDRDPRFTLVPFLTDMPARMAAATLVVCRAGAMSVSELAAARCAAILVPSPNVAGDHQRKNAEVLARAGAAAMLAEEEIDALPDTVFRLLSDGAARAALSAAISAFAAPEANRLIFLDILRLTEKKRNFQNI